MRACAEASRENNFLCLVLLCPSERVFQLSHRNPGHTYGASLPTLGAPLDADLARNPIPSRLKVKLSLVLTRLRI